MTSTQTVTLESLPHNPNYNDPTSSSSRSNKPSEPAELLGFDPANPDTVIIASRLADAEVPDGGYGWVVILACSMLTFWSVGTTYCWGIMQAALVARKLSSPSTIAFVGSLTCAFISILALVNARVIKVIGARSSSLVGMGLLGLGEILSGFSTRSVGGLFCTAGVVMGLGCRYVYDVIFCVIVGCC